MKKTFKTAALLGAMTLVGGAQAAGVSGQGSWQSTLLARDLDGNLANGPEAFYDTTLQITWLDKVKQYGDSWDNAKTWAAGLNVNGVTGWRLPTIMDTGTAGCDLSGAGGTDCGYNVQTKSGAPTQYESGQTVYSEMAHLFYVTLGNKGYRAPGTGYAQDGWGLTNTGNFQNLKASHYWSGTGYAPYQNSAWRFNTHYGNQDFDVYFMSAYALAVRPGDVAATVPEPETYALMLLGLGAVLVARRRRAL
ncbi:PEP-CTERM sorting domain-containing protein [Roseateles albus]|uniref:PEP-CTERM sorting domain-containing protein n=1 Tax=Roseateles albus TaxID=2987525 RepID=A0ABT5KD39_9BURK|nr:PEP-CTERM sorting domain-containing protein [Roseateles albus]MDC8771788.1 PEP-CTERM sorting domain-containing protein [Roseateles albus]